MGGGKKVHVGQGSGPMRDQNIPGGLAGDSEGSDFAGLMRAGNGHGGGGNGAAGKRRLLIDR